MRANIISLANTGIRFFHHGRITEQREAHGQALALYAQYRAAHGDLSDPQVIESVLFAISFLGLGSTELLAVYDDYVGAGGDLRHNDITGLVLGGFVGSPDPQRSTALLRRYLEAGGKPAPELAALAMQLLSSHASQARLRESDRAQPIGLMELVFDRTSLESCTPLQHGQLLGGWMFSLYWQLCVGSVQAREAHELAMMQLAIEANEAGAVALRQDPPIRDLLPADVNRRVSRMLDELVARGGAPTSTPLLESLAGIAVFRRFGQNLPMDNFDDWVSAFKCLETEFPIAVPFAIFFLHVGALSAGAAEYERRARSNRYPNFFGALRTALSDRKNFRVKAHDVTHNSHSMMMTLAAAIDRHRRGDQAGGRELLAVGTPHVYRAPAHSPFMKTTPRLMEPVLEMGRAFLLAWLRDGSNIRGIVEQACFEMRDGRSMTMSLLSREERRAFNGVTAGFNQLGVEALLLAAEQLPHEADELREAALHVDDETRALEVAFDLWVHSKSKEVAARTPHLLAFAKEADVLARFPEVAAANARRCFVERAPPTPPSALDEDRELEELFNPLGDESEDMMDFVDNTQVLSTVVYGALSSLPSPHVYVSARCIDERIRFLIAARDGGRIRVIWSTPQTAAALDAFETVLDRVCSKGVARSAAADSAWMLLNHAFVQQLQTLRKELRWDDVLCAARELSGTAEGTPLWIAAAAEGVVHGLPLHVLTDDSSVRLATVLGIRTLWWKLLERVPPDSTSMPMLAYFAHRSESALPLDFRSEAQGLVTASQKHGAGTCLLGGTADPPASVDGFFEHARHARVAVVSGHGVDFPTRPWDSGVELDGGILSANSLVQGRVRLSRCRLVYLSSCSVGRSRQHRRESVGLVSALIGAGARSVVGGLWPIFDDIAAQFGRDLVEHAGPALFGTEVQPGKLLDAFHAAMSRLKTLYPDEPSLWAGFAFFGLP